MGAGGGARVSEFFSKDPNQKRIFFWGGGGLSKCPNLKLN